MVEGAEGAQTTAVGAASAEDEAAVVLAGWEANWVGPEESLAAVATMEVAAAGLAATVEAAMGLVAAVAPWAPLE